MAILAPKLAFDCIENATSFAARTAAFHTGSGVTSFLRDLGIAPMALLSGEPKAIHRLCEVTGADFSVLSANTATRAGKREYVLRGEKLSCESLVRPRVSFCPVCLMEDDALHADPAVAGRHRWFWALNVVRTCPDHNVPMIRLAKQNHDDELVQFGSRIVERCGALAHMVESQQPRFVSDLQLYVLDRFDGVSGPAWLDGQSIEQAQWVTEMLGAILEFGPGIRLDNLTDDQRDEAGRVGFAHTAEGPTGVYRALQTIFESTTCAGSRPGAQMVFGPLYTAIATKCRVKDRGPIKTLLREFIFDHFALEAGATVLDGILPSRRRHSVASLAKEAGLDSRMVSNALMRAGLIPCDKDGQRITVDATEGRRIVATIRRAVHLQELSAVLNTTRSVAKLVIDDQILQPIVHSSAMSWSHTSKAIDRRDLDALLAAISNLVQPVGTPQEGQLPLVQAAETAKTRAGNILHLMLAGALKQVVRIEDEEGIGALRFDLDEIRPLIRKIEKVGPSPAEAAGKIRVPVETMIKLAEAPDAPIKFKSITSRTSHIIPRVSEPHFQRFQRDFTSLPPIAETLSIRCPDLGRALSAAGIKPAFAWRDFGAEIYRRSDLRGFRPD